MPDGDVFERKLHGKGWRKAFRAALGKSDFNDLVWLLNNAKDEAIRKGFDCPALDEIGDLVYESLNKPLFDATDFYYQLTLNLDALAISQTAFPGTRLAIEAAKRLYAHLNAEMTPLQRDQVKRKLRQEFTTRILDKEFFSKVREGLMEKSGRNYSEQIIWEKNLTDAVLSYKRTVERRSTTQEWGLDRLNAPLQILGG